MSHPFVRQFLPSLAAVLLLGLGAWWLTHSAPSSTNAASPPALAAAPRSIDAVAIPPAEPTAMPSSPEAAPPTSASPAPAAAAPSPGPAAAPVATPAPVSRAFASPAPTATPPSLPPPGAPAAPTEDRHEGLRDRTGGWGKAIARQLNTELMPLASECVDLAQARNPGLAGMLAVELTLAPVDADRAIVEAVKPAPSNEISDPELLECLRQSSFALEDLRASYSFTLSIPIKAAVTLKAPSSS